MAIKLEAKRNTRLRKKLRTGEFQELGFDVAWVFNPEVSEEQIDAIVDQFINDVIEPNKLGFSGEGHKAWEGLVCTQQLGKCTDEHREAVQTFFAKQPVSDLQVSELFDLWWG
ncbi:YggL family protein [Ferrimonas balearica]|uniref:YggL family protein n=1 Tax=Ferrimonas balearica TaxID=44012 RepID=UPI001C99D52B|nr:YggL family protein [Ferrimonas balearica]MBY5921795.1 YggL family protein [Ferrimonas balearica]MBY5994865.1 YggL family protein [Ferrimonas balearica]